MISLLGSIQHKIQTHFRRKKYEKESFRARMQMEQNEQKRISHRLDTMEISFRNQGRLK